MKKVFEKGIMQKVFSAVVISIGNLISSFLSVQWGVPRESKYSTEQIKNNPT